MATKQICCFMFVSMFSLCSGANPLHPQTPVIVVNTENVYMPPTVAGTAAGFMTVSVVNSGYLQSNFSINNGATWSYPTAVNENSYLTMWVAGNADGFMSTWIGADIGLSTAAPLWSFSTNQGNTWTDSAFIIPGGADTTIYSPVAVCATAAGFMAAWRDNNDNNAYVAFTSNNGTHWSTPIEISEDSGAVDSPVMLAGTVAGFMATWVDTGARGWSIFSSDNGATWGDTSAIASSVDSDMWVAGNATGFMATWADDTGHGWSQFSTDNGDLWGDPIAITDNVLQTGTPTDISVSASEIGFVAAWIGTDSNAYASFSTGGTSAWSTPVQITDDGSVSVGNVFYDNNGYGFVDVSVVGNKCMFTWLGNDNNTYSSYSRVGAALNPPTGLIGIQQKNNFGCVYEVFNTLQWTLSTSTDVVGYYVYKNGSLIGTVNALTTSFEDHNQIQGVSTTYSVASFDAGYDISSVATVIIS